MDWSQINIRIGTCGRVRCEPGWHLGPDWWKQLRDFDLWLVWAGRGQMRTSERELDLHPGICLWMRPGRCYEATQDPSNRLGVTYLHFTILDKKGSAMKSCSDIPAEVHVVRDLPFFDAVSRRIVELEQKTRSVHNMVANRTRSHAEDMMPLLLRELDWYPSLEKEGPASSAFRYHRDKILEHVSRLYESPGDAPEVRQLARQCGCSSDHYTRIFKAVTGSTPQNLRIHARIDRARRLLDEASLSISQIAEALGYSDVFHFSRQFKQKTGHAPLHYRRRSSP